MSTETKTLFDLTDDFDDHSRTAQSLLSLLESQILDVETTCQLEVNHPSHPVQEMHSLCVALRHQFELLEVVIQSVRTYPKAAA